MPKTHYQKSIVERFMTAAELNEFERRYNESKKAFGKTSYTPSEDDKRLAESWFNDEIDTGLLAHGMGCGENTALIRAAKIMKQAI